MGFGIYVVWPAFYTDITESYRLGRWGRLRADLGGVYFNAIFVLAMAGLYLATRLEFLLLVALVAQFEIVRQLLPLLRLDGYYVVSDLVGVPDLFARIKPILLSALPGREPDDRVRQLKPWVRVVVTVWVLAVVAFLLVYVTMLLFAAPRIVSTAWDSFTGHSRTAGEAFGEGAWARAALAGVQMLVLALPAAGLTYTAVKLGHRFVRAWRSLRGRPWPRVGLAGGAALLVGVLAYVWWPAEPYRPIGPDERWTVQETFAAAARLSSGPGAAVGDTSDSSSTDPGGSTAGGATEPSPSPTGLGGVAGSPSPSPSPSPSRSPSPSPSPSVSPSPTSTPSPSPSPSP